MKQRQVTLWSAVVVAGHLGWTPAAVAAADLQKVIENGKPPTAMVAGKGLLADQDIQNVLAYVKMLRK